MTFNIYYRLAFLFYDDDPMMIKKMGSRSTHAYKYRITSLQPRSPIADLFFFLRRGRAFKLTIDGNSLEEAEE